MSDPSHGWNFGAPIPNQHLNLAVWATFGGCSSLVHPMALSHGFSWIPSIIQSQAIQPCIFWLMVHACIKPMPKVHANSYSLMSSHGLSCTSSYFVGRIVANTSLYHLKADFLNATTTTTTDPPPPPPLSHSTALLSSPIARMQTRASIQTKSRCQYCTSV